MMELFDNKSYVIYDISNNPGILLGSVTIDDTTYLVDSAVTKKLAKELGFSHDLYLQLADLDMKLANDLVSNMSQSKKLTAINLLIDSERLEVLDYSTDIDRTPVLNSEFFDVVNSLVAACKNVKVTEKVYNKDSEVSSILIERVSPIQAEEKFTTGEVNLIDYRVGILLLNEENNGTYTRLVVYINDQPVYLPPSFYNATSSRFKRSTSTSRESLEVLVLKVIEDLRDETVKSKIQDFHYKYRYNKSLTMSYEEYNSLVKTLKKIPTVIEEDIPLESLSSEYDAFEDRYPNLEDQKSSYLWRCTALGEMTLGHVLYVVSKFLSDLFAPYDELYQVRELLGSYVSLNRMASEIAKVPKEV